MRKINNVQVDLTGFESKEIMEKIYHKLEIALNGKFRMVREPRHISIHCKMHEKDGKRHRYSIIMKMESEYGLISVNKEGWDLLSVIDESLDSLEEVVRRKKEKIKR